MSRFPDFGRPCDKEGSFGEIWFDKPNRIAYKKFKATAGRRDREQIIQLKFVLERSRPSTQRIFTTQFAWPLEVYGQQTADGEWSTIDGYSMPMASDRFVMQMPWRDPTWDTQKISDLQWLVAEEYRNQATFSKPLPDIEVPERVEVAHQLLLACIALWESGCHYGDFSFTNIIWTANPLPAIMFLDADTISTDRNVDRRVHSAYFKEFVDVGRPAIEKDVVFATLAVWRILYGGLSSTPDDPSKDLGRQFNDVKSSVKAAWKTGSLDSIQVVRDRLQAVRSEAFIRSRFEEELNSQQVFARLLLEHELPRASKDEQQMIKEAREQLRREEEFEKKPHRKRKPTLSSLFTFDAATATEFDVLNDQLLRAAFRDGDFDAIANELPRVRSTSANLEIIRRAVEHALVETPLPKIASLPIPRGVEIQFAWPPGDWINRAILTVLAPAGAILRSYQFERGRTSTRMRITSTSGQIIDAIEMAWAAGNGDDTMIVESPSKWRCSFASLAGAMPPVGQSTPLVATPRPLPPVVPSSLSDRPIISLGIESGVDVGVTEPTNVAPRHVPLPARPRPVGAAPTRRGGGPNGRLRTAKNPRLTPIRRLVNRFFGGARTK